MLSLRYRRLSVLGRSVLVVAAVAAVASLLLETAAAAAPATVTTAPSATGRPTAQQPPGPEPESGRWLVRLAKPSLAAVTASDDREAPAGELDVTTPASVSYLDQLERQQDAVLGEIEAALGRRVEVAYAYRNVLNGLALAVDATEAAQIAELPGVVAVEPDQEHSLQTDASHELIASTAVWEGETGEGVGTRGEGVVVGVIDSGINPLHPSFAAVDGDGYRHTNPYGEGNYLGHCDPGNDGVPYEDICNDKLVGAWRMAGGVGTGAADDDGHGSHVGSTIAGNRHEAAVTVGDDTHTRTIQGVAPRANVISYKVCADYGFFGYTCFNTDSVAAVEQAIADGVDVLNFSIGGGDNPWALMVDQAFLEAAGAGIFVAASAGNNGPGPGTATHTGPWNATVAATTHHRIIASTLDVTAPAPVPPELTGLAAVPGDGSPVAPLTGRLRYAGSVDPANAQGCEPFPAGAFDGELGLVVRGDCAFSDKLDHAADAGATGVVVVNNSAGPPLTMSGLDGATIPAVMLSDTDGERLRDHLDAAGDTPVEVAVGTGSEVLLDDDWADVVAEFSSRGPSELDLLAPTFAAPGRNILAAYSESDGDPVQYAFLQGTSMASPHAAGAGALLAALHPDWSPAQIQSALAVTADRDEVVTEDGISPAGPFDIGSGRINLARAAVAGLTLDETHENFAAADPAAGGDPKTLNLPAIVDQHCDQVCTFTREVSSVAGVSVDYTVAASAPDGVTVTADPAGFTLAPGGSQQLTITVDVTGQPREDWRLGGIDLVADATHGPDGPPVAGAHFPVAVLPAQPELTVDPVELASSALDVGQTETHPVTVGNAGGAELSWQVTQDGDGCALPDWVDATPDEGTLTPFSEQEVEVRFDATGLDDGGVFTANLCLASNDPDRPRVEVALELTVVPVPVAEVTPGALGDGPALPAGLVAEHTVAVRNAGHGVLDWTLAHEDAGPSDERLQRLRDGLLLIPNQSTGAVMAFDQQTGDLLDEEFIPWHQFSPDRETPFSYSPIHLLVNQAGDGFLMADQLRWMITEYDLSGNFRRVFAPTTGERGEIIGNIRGMSWSPSGTLLVTVSAGANAHSVVELDADGNYLGTFVEPGLDGLNGPWSVLVRDDDVLVGASRSSAIHRFSRDGSTAGERFAELNWPGQLVELANGNILTVNWSGGDGPGVREYDREGNLIGSYAASGSSYKGVHELDNGNLLVTTSTGVHEIDRAGEVFETKASGLGTARYITRVQLPEAMGCSTPDEVPWLSVSQADGDTGAGETTELTVSFDTTGLARGSYQVQLCLVSNDPATPLVAVPVTLEVTDQTCDRVITGRHAGPVAVRTGVTCLAPGAEVHGAVTVSHGAGLVAPAATIDGPVTAIGADVVVLTDARVIGPVAVVSSTGQVTIAGATVTGQVLLTRNRTGGTPIVVSGNQIAGPLSCTGNQPPPVDNGVPNTVTGRKGGQCAAL